MIPFSPPRIDQKIIDSVTEALTSGWITTGPKTKLFEKNLTAYAGHVATLCVNSGSAGLELILRWYGVKEGDEVILPAYTYAATANVVVHCGARPIMVDSGDDFNISVEAVRQAITPRTKVVMPVDLGGYPCDYDEINALVKEDSIRLLFRAETAEQQQLGRILVLSDAAHSIGAIYKGRKTGVLTDITVYSFHAVKNLTTAEGGAICLNLPFPFSNEEVYKVLNTKSLHGQNKDALAKTQIGNWKYDIVEAGYKCNMTDIMASIGLVELERYDNDNMVRRRQIFDTYAEAFRSDERFIVPEYFTDTKSSSFHVFLLRLRCADEEKRDAVIAAIFARQVAVNVHFRPLPLMTYYMKSGYYIHDYPVAWHNYCREISLPVYYDLTDEQVSTVISVVKEAVTEVLG
ncbi:MAG: capsular biosynthesis protein [Bacteroidetes bacterium HGW-Bacteroidetes-22]|nr:MAG: capsular biosynthesis protein [Bacteroidetes bacterium HGW-Bacteroidetes-22]